MSDVRFIVEGQPIPAVKTYLSIKSKVFRVIFSGKFKESNDKEIAIEDTTYEAFKTFIQFLYCEELVLKDDNDFKLIGELYRLCDRYDVSRLSVRLTDKLYEKSQTLIKSRKDFKEVWPKMQSILLIAFEYKIEKLMDKVIQFIDEKFDHFIKEDNKVLIQLNDWTDGRLFTLMAINCSDDSSFNPSPKLQKFKQLLILMTKKCKQLSEVIESLKKDKSFNCDKCGAIDHAQSIDTSTK